MVYSDLAIQTGLVFRTIPNSLQEGVGVRWGEI